jgi:hypothetical protein
MATTMKQDTERDPFAMSTQAIHRRLDALSRTHARTVEDVARGRAQPDRLREIEEERAALARALPVRQAVEREQAAHRQREADQEQRARGERLVAEFEAEMARRGADAQEKVEAAIAALLGLQAIVRTAYAGFADVLPDQAVDEVFDLHGPMERLLALAGPLEAVLAVGGLSAVRGSGAVLGERREQAHRAITRHVEQHSRRLAAAVRRRLPVVPDSESDPVPAA